MALHGCLDVLNQGRFYILGPNGIRVEAVVSQCIEQLRTRISLFDE